MAAKSADSVKQDEIVFDMGFISSNISADGKQLTIINNDLQNELLRRSVRTRAQEETDKTILYAQYQGIVQYMNQRAAGGDLGGGCFATLHGGPLSSSDIASGVPPIFKVPDNCMVVMLAPPGTVVYGGEEEDMMSWRFFKQNLCFGAGASGSIENCYGADGKKASVKRNLDQANEFEIPPDEKEDVKKMSPAEFVSYRHRKLAEKRERLEEKRRDKSAIASGQCTEDAVTEITRQMTPRPFMNAEGGHEILENMQLFFGRIVDNQGNVIYPGDYVYNQMQTWEDVRGRDSQGNALYDPNFDMFNLGSVFPSWLDTFDTTGFDGNKPPAGTELPHLKGTQVSNLEVGVVTQPGIPCSLFNGQTPDMVHTLSKQGAKGSPMTTQQLCTELAKRNCRFIVLNSCSPYQTPQRQHRGRRGSRSMSSRVGNPAVANLLLRNYLMSAGRQNFCGIRVNCISEIQRHSLNASSVVVPQYDEHRGITISMKDDRQEFYQTIGHLLGRAIIEPIFTPRVFRAILDLCDKSDKTGKQLEIFGKMYDRFYERKPNSSKRAFNLLPFDAEIEMVEAERRGSHPMALNTHRQQAFANMQGGKRKRRRKRKTKKRKTKRRKKKTRRRRKKRTRRLKKK
tara:strand:+ start:734 stop:2608 length:1875 start_codon:yes stop_codon:yes gene_type:complete